MEVPPWTPPADAGPAIDADQPVLVGTVIKVTDGDTIRVQLSSGPVSVRFDSIDAPEKDQPWGAEAQRALAARLDGQQVALDVVEQDRYERLVAVVLLGEENINGWMVQQGHAWAYRQYLRDKDYCAWEGIARATRRGMWGQPGGAAAAPWEWRQVKRGGTQGFTDYSRETVQNCIAAMRKRSSDSAARPPAVSTTTNQSAPPGRCQIKGNISQSGRIYHVPGSPSYASTQIDESKGERWFCSEEEAQAAGWRAPR
jgi:endonuclease YncB( thermonuclease family)